MLKKRLKEINIYNDNNKNHENLKINEYEK